MYNRLIVFIFGLCIGFLLFNASAATIEKDVNQFDNWVCDKFGIDICTSMRFGCGGWTLHVHHWMLMVLLAGILYMYHDTVSSNLAFIAYGFCLGGVIQGLTYSDRFDILYKIQ